MKQAMFEVQQRRGELLARIASQRADLALIERQWQVPVTLIDQSLTVLNFLRSHPVLLASVTGLLVIRRHGAFSLLKAGWRVWKGYQHWGKLSAKLTPKL